MARFIQEVIEEGAGVGKLYEGDVFVDDVKYKYWVTHLSTEPGSDLNIQTDMGQKNLTGVLFLKKRWKYLYGRTFQLVISEIKKFKIIITLEGPLGKWHCFKRAAG